VEYVLAEGVTVHSRLKAFLATDRAERVWHKAIRESGRIVESQCG